MFLFILFFSVVQHFVTLNFNYTYFQKKARVTGAPVSEGLSPWDPAPERGHGPTLLSAYRPQEVL